MNREQFLQQIGDRTQLWDVIVVGGGATGLGTAVDAAARGYKTLLLEQHDFAKGTSSRSTKLIHGGVRYLRQGEIPLVRESLRERGLLLRQAPHLVHERAFIVPAYHAWQSAFYGAGLKIYDALAGRLGIRKSRLLSRAETFSQLPNLAREGVRGGVIYYDGQFDDSRLAINLAQTAAGLGGVLVNYMRVLGFLKAAGWISGVRAADAETAKEFEIRGRVIINATGVFSHQILTMDEPGATALLRASQGVHLVFDQAFLPGESALMIPHTDDGRVLFAVPWLNRVIVGTTDTPVEEVSLEPRALDQEVEFLLQHARRYLARAPGRSDVLSVFAGLRPLVTPGKASRTAAISRDYLVIVSPSGLVTVTGGKWTTYRKMGEAAVDRAILVAGLEKRPSRTRALPIHGSMESLDPTDPLSIYGSDARAIRDLVTARPALGERLHSRFPYLKAQVLWAARQEMARSVEDVLARRMRALFLDARASVEAAPAVAHLLAAELGRGQGWEAAQIASYSELARGYLLA